MAIYIDQAVKVCDELIAQAKHNKEHYGSVFSPVSLADEKERIRTDLLKEIEGVSLQELEQDLNKKKAAFLKHFSEAELKRYRRGSNLLIPLPETWENAHPDLTDEYTDLVIWTMNLQAHRELKTPKGMEEAVQSRMGGIPDKPNDRLRVDLRTRIADEDMIELILDVALERILGEYKPCEVEIKNGHAILDIRHNAKPVNLLELRKEIDTTMRAAFSDKSKWQQMRGNQPRYILKANLRDPLYQVMRPYYEITGGPEGMSDITREKDAPHIMVEKAAIQEVLNEGLGLQIPMRTIKHAR
jgi:hypothetical protein